MIQFLAGKDEDWDWDSFFTKIIENFFGTFWTICFC